MMKPQRMTDSPNSVDEPDRLDDLARDWGLHRVRTVSEVAWEPDWLDQLPIEWVRRVGVFPVRHEGRAAVLIPDPQLEHMADDVNLLLGIQCVPILADSGLIESVVEQAYFSKRPAENASEAQDLNPVKDHPAFLQDDLLSTSSNAPAIQFVNRMLIEAVREGASDIHLEPGDGALAIRFRLDGLLHERPAPPRELQAVLTARIKVMAALDIAEKRLPQDGTARVRVGRREIDIRVSTLPVAGGERVVLRLLHRDQLALHLEGLGMSERMYRQFLRLLREPNGVIWVTGPTGSGKTTTLYAALQELDRERLNILTIEDPVEYQLPGMGQMSVKPSIGLTFAAGLRHLLRQDPDVLLVGETRDEETAEIVIRASLTGHLVFTTLHTNDAAGSFARLLDMGVPAYLLAASTRASLAQRLVRKLCPNCRREKLLQEADLRPDFPDISAWMGQRVYEPQGCDACIEGYRGRLGLYELLLMNEELQHILRPGCSLSDIREAACRAGGPGLLEDGLSKVAAGQTSLQELERVLGVSLRAED